MHAYMRKIYAEEEKVFLVNWQVGRAVYRMHWLYCVDDGRFCRSHKQIFGGFLGGVFTLLDFTAAQHDDIHDTSSGW